MCATGCLTVSNNTWMTCARLILEQTHYNSPNGNEFVRGSPQPTLKQNELKQTLLTIIIIAETMTSRDHKITVDLAR